MDILTAAQMLDVIEEKLLEAGLRKDEIVWFYCWIADRKSVAKNVEDPAFMDWFHSTDRKKLISEFREYVVTGLMGAAAAAEERQCP